MGGFHDPAGFAFVPGLEAAFAPIRAEAQALAEHDWIESPDSLTTVTDGYDERGWRYFDLFGVGDFEANRRRCPVAGAACTAVPGMQNAGFSRFRRGTRLYPHRGEIPNVLRCHLPLVVPAGDQGLRIGDETRIWHPGRCLVFDDTFEHEAWNRGDGDRVVLLVTFVRS